MLSLVWVVVNSASALAFSDFRLVSKTAVSALIRLISCLVLAKIYGIGKIYFPAWSFLVFLLPTMISESVFLFQGNDPER